MDNLIAALEAQCPLELSKHVRKPDIFRHSTREDEQVHWDQWAFSFKMWLSTLDDAMVAELEQIERDPEIEVTRDVLGGAERQGRSHRVYALLATFVEGRSAMVVRSLREERNGYEVWRQLTKANAPRSRQRAVALTQSIMSLKEFKKVLQLLISSGTSIFGKLGKKLMMRF